VSPVLASNSPVAGFIEPVLRVTEIGALSLRQSNSVNKSVATCCKQSYKSLDTESNQTTRAL